MAGVVYLPPRCDILGALGKRRCTSCVGDLRILPMSGVAEVATQSGRHAAATIGRRLAG
jgi:hypothetical protein